MNILLNRSPSINYPSTQTAISNLPHIKKPENRELPLGARQSEADGEDQIDPSTDSRFSKLTYIDEQYLKVPGVTYKSTFGMYFSLGPNTSTFSPIDSSFSLDRPLKGASYEVIR